MVENELYFISTDCANLLTNEQTTAVSGLNHKAFGKRLDKPTQQPPRTMGTIDKRGRGMAATTHHLFVHEHQVVHCLGTMGTEAGVGYV